MQFDRNSFQMPISSSTCSRGQHSDWREPAPQRLPYRWLDDRRRFSFRQIDINQQPAELVEIIRDLQPQYVSASISLQPMREVWRREPRPSEADGGSKTCR